MLRFSFETNLPTRKKTGFMFTKKHNGISEGSNGCPKGVVSGKTEGYLDNRARELPG